MKRTINIIEMQAYGAASVLQAKESQLEGPQAGEINVKTEAVGVNFSDVLRRQNRYFMPTPLPFVLGAEVAGTIVESGEGVSAPFLEGARVLAILPLGGGYADYVKVRAEYCVPLPPEIDAKSATAIFVQGSTAALMVNELAGKLEGKTVFIQASTGGVGSLLVQLAKMKGARVIAGTSSAEKIPTAKKLGADEVIIYSEEGWGEQLKTLTEGKGVDVVFEMIGGEVYHTSVKSLKQGGQIIIYGCASGVQGKIDPEYFVDENIQQTGFNLAHWVMNKPQAWQQAMGEIIGWVAQKKLQIFTPHQYSLKDAAIAHAALEDSKTVGKVVLIP